MIDVRRYNTNAPRAVDKIAKTFGNRKLQRLIAAIQFNYYKKDVKFSALIKLLFNGQYF